MSKTAIATAKRKKADLHGAPAADPARPLHLDPDRIRACIEEGRPLKELLDVDDQVLEAIYAMGHRNYQMGQFAGAEHWWFHVCLFDCKRDRNWISLGMAHQKQGKYGPAIDAYSLAVQHGSNNPWAPLHAAECHIQLKNLEAAAKALDSAEKWAGNVPQKAIILKRVAVLRKGLNKRLQRLAMQPAGAGAGDT